LWSAIRALEEHVLLLRHLADHVGSGSDAAGELRRRADRAQEHATLVRQAVLGQHAGRETSA